MSGISNAYRVAPVVTLNHYPYMVEFFEITDSQIEDFNSALDIYAEAFPINERQPLNVLRERIGKGLNKIYIGRRGTEVVFMALLWPLQNTDFILLDYMATNARYRGSRIGSLFLQKMLTILEENQKYLIIEVENPTYGHNQEERKKRVAFYKRNGAKELKNVRYVLPALQGSTPTEMILMIYPEYQQGKIDATLVNNLIVQIYKELYNREAEEFISAFFKAKGQIELV